MRHALTLLLVLCMHLFGASQIEPQLVSFASHEAAIDSSESPIWDEKSINKIISFSEGFTDSSFHHQIDLEVNGDQRLSLATDFPRTLQFSISNVEGIILRKGKFYGSGIVNLSSLKNGSYAVYFFAGNKIVRALMIEHRQAAM